MTHPTPERLGAYLDGELDLATRAAVDAHLVECAECASHLADLSAVDDAAREVPVAAPAGYFEAFAPRVRARLEKRSRRFQPPVWGWAVAAALLLAVVTPLALREADAPASAPMVDRTAGAPSRTLGPTGGGDFKQNAAPPPATVPLQAAKPAAPAAELSLPDGAPAAEPEAAARLRDTRANAPGESRVLRRDRAEQDAAAGADAPALPPPQAIAPQREEQAKRELDALEDRSKLAKDDDEALRARGYVAPPPAPTPPTGQRQHRPRSQTAVQPAPAARKAAAESKTEPEKDKEQPADAVAQKTEEARVGGMQEAVTVTQDSVGLAAGRESMKFRSLARSKPPRSDAEARALRESWRVFASEHPDHPQADEARVRMVEAGALAYRLGRRPQDREVALRDGRDYLERPLAPQADRVKVALKKLETSAP